IDSIAFHLYTDSLKKGQHNYINVDGKYSDGKWLPLSNIEIKFSASDGVFEGNELVIPADFKKEKVTVKAVLRSNPAIWKQITIWIKTIPDPDKLPTNEEILKQKTKTKSKSKG
ncbi:MAG: hypothetical protein C4308_07660, partial [Chitinophagaceae bacterium]